MISGGAKRKYLPYSPFRNLQCGATHFLASWILPKLHFEISRVSCINVSPTAGSTSNAAQCNAARFSLQCVQLAASGYRWKTRLASAWMTERARTGNGCTWAGDERARTGNQWHISSFEAPLIAGNGLHMDWGRQQFASQNASSARFMGKPGTMSEESLEISERQLPNQLPGWYLRGGRSRWQGWKMALLCLTGKLSSDSHLQGIGVNMT